MKSAKLKYRYCSLALVPDTDLLEPLELPEWQEESFVLLRTLWVGSWQNAGWCSSSRDLKFGIFRPIHPPPERGEELEMELRSFFTFFFFFRAAPVAHGGSQARGPIRAVAAGLHQSHGNQI